MSSLRRRLLVWTGAGLAGGLLVAAAIVGARARRRGSRVRFRRCR
jgi:hypothetical protein